MKNRLVMNQYAWVSAKNLSGLTQKLSETFIPLCPLRPTLREAADAPLLLPLR